MSIWTHIASCIYLETEIRSNKVKFSLNKAKIKAQQYGQSYYKCNHCGYYHLTRQNTYDSIMNQESEEEC